jgi:2-phosphosulfolactate phosphatase
MIQLSVHLTPHQVDELALRDKRVVVVDVLRAGTTVTTALSNGAREVIPTSSVESAAKISGNLTGSIMLLAGERNGKMVEGFHLGNSPSEYTAEKVRGKAVVFISSNGSPVFLKARYAREMAVCSFVNLRAVAESVREIEGDLVIVCAGGAGGFALEDAVCAGMLMQILSDHYKVELRFGDAGAAALALQKVHARNLLRMLRETDNGKALVELGFEEDLKYCAGLDTIPVVPALDGTVLHLRRSGDKKDTPADVPAPMEK